MSVILHNILLLFYLYLLKCTNLNRLDLSMYDVPLYQRNYLTIH
nr:MAG TPA: hypothetical protein [Caudoviricetes sp.]